MSVTGIPRWTDSRFVLVVSAAMFAAITALRFVFVDPAEPYLILYVLPIGLIANQFGVRAGLAMAGLALAVLGVWSVVEDPPNAVIGFLVKGVPFVAIGAGLGLFQRMRAREERQNTRWFSMSNQMQCEANFDGYLTRVNGAWTTCLGYTAEEMMSRPYFELVHPDDQQSTLDVAGALMEKDFAVVSFRNRYRAKDGSWHWLSWSSRSDSERIYASATDVTDLVDLETERDLLLEKVEALSRTDELTNLPNRRAWDEEIRREFARSRRLGFEVSVAMIDLDHFKLFNDSYGHPAGDQLLCDAARRWRGVLRESDFLARIGGEEFAVLLPNCPATNASSAAERLRVATPDSETCCVGVALWNGHESPASVLSRADVALYAAKDAGRDCAEFAAV